ncbi:MAG: glycosyltransferase family 9 protein [Planctomycetes bacterium]|nr:glycosyltransferase family 9 protein [Planctomycetota bacterium]
MESAPAKVLIVRLGAIGDVVNATLVASALRRAWPETEIGWAVHELASPLVLGHPSIDRVHVWRKGTGLTGFRAVLADVRSQRYDLAIDLQRIAKSAVLARLSGARRVLGFDRMRTKEASWLLTRERVAPRTHRGSMVEQYLEFVQHLGLDSSIPTFELPLDATAVARAEERMRELGPLAVLMHLGATKPANRWAPERFAEVARRLLDRGYRVALTGGPGDAELALRAVAIEPRLTNWCGATSLLELAELQRRSALVLSCDSGPMHLAAAAGALVVALFGPADERRTGPFGARHTVVRTRPPCAPCNLRHCNQTRHACMEDLTTDAVSAAVFAALDRRAGS